MFKSLTHISAFFLKEVSEIFRQPRLILSLILGPFLILLLFGMSFKGGLPHFRVALVVPENSVSPQQLDEVKKVIGTNFTVVSTDSNLAGAETKLRNGEVDIVEVLPSNFSQNMQEGKQTPVQIEYSQIDPTNESWVQYLGSSQVEAMNRIVLKEAISHAQQQANTLSNMPPETVVSPLIPKYTNLRGKTLSFVTFYAPAVFALLNAAHSGHAGCAVPGEREAARHPGDVPCGADPFEQYHPR